MDKVKPTDFTVITVNYTSVWTREVVYQIPEGMPKCGDGGCLCTWNWIHQVSLGHMRFEPLLIICRPGMERDTVKRWSVTQADS